MASKSTLTKHYQKVVEALHLCIWKKGYLRQSFVVGYRKLHKITVNVGFYLTSVRESMTTKVFVDQECFDTIIAISFKVNCLRCSPAARTYMYNGLKSNNTSLNDIAVSL